MKSGTIVLINSTKVAGFFPYLSEFSIMMFEEMQHTL